MGTCPHCGSTNVLSFSAFHTQNTIRQQGIGVFSRLGTGQANVFLGESVNQSLLAQHCAPPEAPKGVGWPLYVGITYASTGALFFAVMFSKEPRSLLSFGGLFFFLLFLVPGGIGLWLVFVRLSTLEDRRRAYGLKMKAWRQKWICLQCNNAFTVSVTRIT